MAVLPSERAIAGSALHRSDKPRECPSDSCPAAVTERRYSADNSFLGEPAAAITILASTRVPRFPLALVEMCRPSVLQRLYWARRAHH